MAYHIAFKKVFYTLKGIRSIHIRDIHIQNRFCNTNKQELGIQAFECKSDEHMSKPHHGHVPNHGFSETLYSMPIRVRVWCSVSSIISGMSIPHRVDWMGVKSPWLI